MPSSPAPDAAGRQLSDGIRVTTTIAVSALGAVIALEFGDQVPAEIVERVRHAWSGAIAPADAVADLRREVSEVPDPERFMEQLTQNVTLDALAHRRGSLMMLHAAGVALDDGRVVAFTGPSGRGKTTLSRVLARAFGYVSDETIAFDRDLRVLPYRKPLSVIRHGMPKDQVAPGDAGLRPLPDADLRLAAIVLLDRDPEAGAPTVEPLHFLDAAPELIAQTSYLAEIDGTVATLAELCDRVGGVRRLRYAEAADVPAMLESLTGAAPTPEPWAHAELGVRDADGADVVADAVDYGDAMAVLSDRTLRVLEGIAPTVVRAAQTAPDLATIVAAVRAEHGEPPTGDAETLVRSAIAELADAGLVRRV